MARSAINEATTPSTEDLQAQLAALKDDVARLTTALGDYGKAQGSHLRAVANDAAQVAATKGQETLALAQEQASKAYQSAEKNVQDHPAAAMGIAAGVGFLAGLLATRR